MIEQEKWGPEAIYAAIVEERLRQEELFETGAHVTHLSNPDTSQASRLAILAEEFGEVAREVVEYDDGRLRYALDPNLKEMPKHRHAYFQGQLRKELIQVAAVCVAWCEAIDMGQEIDRLEAQEAASGPIGQKLAAILQPEPGDSLAAQAEHLVYVGDLPKVGVIKHSGVDPKSSPHCDALVLHRPGTCRYCDLYPERQKQRLHNNVNFTGEYRPGKQDCPSELRRPLSMIEKWPGNRPAGDKNLDASHGPAP
jgi:hypothetical protein